MGNTWDDAAIADLPATRWGAATALYTDAVLAGGYVGGNETPANISNTVISWDQLSNTWQTDPDMLAPRAQPTGAVLNGNFYVLGGRCTECGGSQGTNDNQKLFCLNAPGSFITSGGSSLVSAGATKSLIQVKVSRFPWAHATSEGQVWFAPRPDLSGRYKPVVA